jgi:hypothetical protein
VPPPKTWADVFSTRLSGARFGIGSARAEEQGACLRIRLRLKDAPELANYPWEYLYDHNVNWFVALSGEAPVVRHLDLPLAIRPLKISLPIRILVIISSPSGCPRLSHEREEKLLDEASAPCGSRAKSS